MAVNKCQANVEIMNKQVADLEDEKEAVKHYIEDNSRSGTDQIELQKRQDWLTCADNLIKAAHKLVNDVEENAQQKCRFGLCLNPNSPNQLSKQAEQNSKDIAEWVQEARKFNIPLSYYQEKLAVSGFENFESRRNVLTEIMEALQSPGVNIIGVHGMPGVGKTMLVREVKRKAEQDKLFDAVVMVTVGRNPDYPRIRDEIARGLGLDGVSDELTSQDLEASNRIKAGLTANEALVILDDIWALGLDLEGFGIPMGGGRKQRGREKKNKDSLSCKILLTSKDPDPYLMGAEKNFPIEPLTEEEAWNQFKKMVVDPAESRSLPFYAKEIAKECKRLPISIATLAKSLKSRTLIEWKTALRKLQSSSEANLPESSSQANLPEIPKGLHLAVELNYGGLKSKEQQTFLLCTLMGHNATIKDLLIYGIGLGLFAEVNSMEKARDEALTLLSKLKDSLLLDGGSNVQFDMHDFIRVVATSIASQDHGMLATSQEDALIRWQDSETIMEKVKWIYSSNFNAGGEQFPGELKCPQLTFFHLSNKDLSPAIPPNLFTETEGLKVLGLIKMNFSSTPSSISLPKKLITLRLDQSKLESVDIWSTLGELKNLQVLSLAGCDIQELPKEVGKLIKLKFLDLSDCTELKVIPPSVLSSLSRLEELYLGNSFAQWDKEQENQRNASLAELTQLKNLTTLEVSICDIQMFQKVLFSTELKRYKIFIGDVWNSWDSSFGNTKILKLKPDANIDFDTIRKLLKKTEELHLDVLNCDKYMVNELDDNGFQQLKYLHVMNCLGIQYMFEDSVEGINGQIFPNLEIFVIHNSIKLEKIFHGQFEQMPFIKLRIIYVQHCKHLKNLFSFSIAKQFLCLQEITVVDCSNIVEIVNNEGQGSTNDGTEGTDVLELAQLQCLRLHHLPEFISFSHEDDTSYGFTSLFNKKVAFPNLERMTISHLENLRMLWQELSENSFCILKSLRVTNCQNLSAIFPSNNEMLKEFLKSLEKLEIIGCSSLKEIEILSSIRILMLDSLDNLRHIFSQDSSSVLQTLKVWQCDSLTCLSTSELASFKNLTTLNVQGCCCMTTLVSVKATQSLGQLVRMTVRECRSLTKIVGSDSFGREDSIINFSKLRFLKLEYLSRLESFYSGKFKFEFSSLEKLVVNQCPKMKIFSEGDLQTPKLQRVELIEGEDKWYWEGDLNTTIQTMCTEKVGFVGLKDLILQDFPEFMEKWHTRSPREILDFSQIECLELCDCNNFKYLLTPSMVPCLVQLQSIIVKGCVMLEQVIMRDGEENKMIFPQLWLIRLESCSNLTTFYAGSYSLEIPALANITVNDCPKMVTFADSTSLEEASQYFFNTKVASHLEVFVLYNLINLERIFHHQFEQTSCFKLRIINVEHCNQLKNLFSFSIAIQLLHLQEITVADCSNIVEIFNDDSEGDYILMLAQLQCLRLQNLPEFISFNLEDDTSSRFTSLFNNKVAFPNLKMMAISHLENSAMIWPKLSESPFFNLKSLRVTYCQNLSTIFPSDKDKLRELMNSLEKLEIIGCSSLEEIEILSSIRILMLDSLDNLRHILSVESSSLLRTLEVRRCGSLTSLSTSELASFTNVTTLNVQGCHCMTTLVSVTAAQSLVQLVHMTVRDCKNLTEIVGNDSLGREDSIINFSKLRFLKLEYLSRLESFYSGEFRFKFSSLEKVVVDQCPKMKIFSEGDLHTPMLQRVELIEGEDKWCWEGDLNTTIQRMYTEKVGFVGLKYLILQDFPELMEKWHKRSPQEISNFSQIECLELCDCNNLKYLLTPSICLVQLQSIIVKGCITLEQVIMGDGEGNKMIFPQLWLIRLESCSNLITFCAGSCHLEIPALANITVNHCPKMITFAASTSSEDASQYFFSSKVAFPRLQQLTIESMESLNKIWDDQRDADSWCQLDTVIVDACKSLRNIFPFSMLERLQKLEKLKIWNCDLLEEIFEYQELGISQSHAQITAQPTLVEATAKFAFPKLTHLNLHDLPKLKCFCRQMDTTEWPSLKKLEVYGCGLQIFASKFLSFQGTNEDNQPEIVIQCPLFHVRKAIFPKLEVLELVDFYMHSSAAIPSLMIELLPNLAKLVVENTFFYGLSITARLNPSLTELSLFVNLQTLEVFQFHGLRNLVTYSSDTKILEQLRTMSIINCKMIEEVLVRDDIFVGAIALPKLKHLHLRDLPRLNRFCSGIRDFELPSLEEVIVSNCPELSSFNWAGRLSTPKLQKVIFEDNKERWERDLNSTIKNHFFDSTIKNHFFEEEASIHLNLFPLQGLIYFSYRL